jgi:hypothetical protein
VAALGISEGLEFQPSDFLLPENSGKFRLGYPQKASSPGGSQH